MSQIQDYSNLHREVLKEDQLDKICDVCHLYTYKLNIILGVISSYKISIVSIELHVSLSHQLFFFSHVYS